MHPPPAVRDLLRLDGVRVLVTGASGHLGQAIAHRLAEAGAVIVAHGFRNPAALDALVASLGGGEARIADLRDAAAAAELVGATRPDAVVNNAAIQTVCALPDLTAGDWRAMQAATLDSAFLVTQAAAKLWRARESGGAIVNIASIEATDPAAGHAHYAAGKAGLAMFTRAAALEYGRDGIRVNAVSPGLVDRDGLERDWPDGVRRWRERVPLGRLGVPNDVADAVLFLLGPAARWISGANLAVDGGMSSQSRW